MGWVDRRHHPPVAVFIDEPSARSQALHHAADGDLLFTRKPKQYKARTDEIE